MADLKPPRRWLRRTLLGVGAAIALLVALFLLLPVFVGWGLFHGRVRDAIGASFNGDVEIDGLSVSWFGTQHIEELRVTGPEGDAEARLKVRLERGLLPLAFGSTDYGTLRLSGAIEGVRYEDGSTSLQKLFKEDEETAPLDMNVRIVSEGIDVSLRDLVTDEVVAVRALLGEVSFVPTGRTDITVKAETSVADEGGHLEVAGWIDGLYDEHGLLALQDAAVNLDARITRLPVAVLDGLLALDGRLAALTGEAIESAEIALEGDLQNGSANLALLGTQFSLDGATLIRDGALLVDDSHSLELSLQVPAYSLHTLMGRDDEAAIALAPGGTAAIVLKITSARIPLPKESGFDLTGGAIAATVEAAEVPLRVRAAESFENIDVSMLRATLESDDMTRTLQLAIDGTGAARGEAESTLSANLTIDYPLSASGEFTLDPGNIEGDISARHLPTVLAQGMLGDSPIVLARDLGQRADLALEFSGGESRAIHGTLAAANASAEVSAMVSPEGGINGELLVIGLDLTPELVAALGPQGIGVPRRVDLHLTSFTWPAAAEGDARSIGSLGAAGTVTFSGEPIVAAAEGADPIRIEVATIDFDSPALFETLTATIAADIEGAPLDASIRTEGAEGDVALTSLEATVAATPALVRALQGAAENPIEARADAITFSLESPATVLTRKESGYEFALDSISLRVKSQEVVIESGPALAEPVAVRGFDGDITASLDEPRRVAVAGRATLHAMAVSDGGAADANPIANATFTLDLPLAAKHGPDVETAAQKPSPAYPALDLTLTEIHVGTVERVLGRDAGSLAKYLGAAGALDFAVTPGEEGFNATLVPQFPYISGTFHAVRNATTIAIDAEDAMITLSASAVSEFLSPPLEPGNLKAPAAVITASGDVPLALNLNTLVLPAEVFNGGPLSSSAAAIDLAVSIRDPISLTRIVAEQEPLVAQFEELALTVKGSDLDEGIAISLAGLMKGAAPDGSPVAPLAEGETEGAQAESQGSSRSRIDIAATLSNLVNDAMELDTADAVFTAQVRARRLPAWIADAAGGTGTMLGDALGESLTAEVNAENFSSNSGTLTANIGGANESRVRATLTGRDGGYAAERGDPITGALTLSPELRNRLLHGIHPIFSDVRALNEQVRFKVRNAFIPAASDEPPATSDANPPLSSVEESPHRGGQARRREGQGGKVSESDAHSSANSQQPSAKSNSSIDLSRLSGIIELTIGPAEFTAGSEFLRILQFVNSAQGGLPSPPGRAAGDEGDQPAGPPEKVIEGYIGPLDGSPIIIRIDDGRLTYENFIIHLEREEDEPTEAPRQPRGERRRERQGEAAAEGASEPSPPGRGQGEGDALEAPVASPADYAHHLLFSGDIDLVNQRVNRIVGAYPLADLVENLSGGGGDVGDLLGLNIANVGVRFFGDLYDASGNPLDLQMEIDFELKVEDLFEEGLRRTPGEDAPALERLLEEIFGK